MKPSFILRAAGIYNVAYGLLLAFCPHSVFHWLGMPETPDIMIQALGMIVGVYGLAYWNRRQRPGKVLAAGGCGHGRENAGADRLCRRSAERSVSLEKRADVRVQ